MEEYRRKRNFERTPEPEPGPRAARPDGFVVHRHEARRLHYDLRLAFDGVLKCFAVPRGFSYRPQDKHLAVQTEDHPIEYTEFRGMIPKGEYGGGTMLIWDEGHYEVLRAENLGQAIEAGEIKLLLFGRRLRGEWHLVRTREQDGRFQWLLFKSKDCYARTAAEAEAPDPGLAPAAPFPARVASMQPQKKMAAPFDDPAWIFEADFDGLRLQIHKKNDDVRLKGTQRHRASDLPHLEAALRRLHATDALLEAVLFVPDANGRPDPGALEDKDALGRAVLYCFDLLYYDEWDTRSLPLIERKEILRALLAPDEHVLYLDHVRGAGWQLARAMASLGLAHMWARRADSAYTSGPSDHWLRIAVPAEAAPTHAKQTEQRRFAIKNAAKIYWPEDQITKGELIEYYSAIADVLLPHLLDRPVHMLRYPDGIDGKWFYQKQVMDYVPDWIETVDVSRDGEEPVRYMMVQNRETLLYLINLGSIDLHPWMSRRQSLDCPDWTFIDLDPKAAPFKHVLRLARETGKLLRGIGLSPYIKTSGKTGMHILVPLGANVSYDQSRMFAESVARIITRENREIATVDRATQKRGQKVYMDFLQNRREQTIVPPYVVRPVPGARVSMPLTWDEVSHDISPSDFHIRNAPERVLRLGDLWRTALSEPQDLATAIAGLEEYLSQS